MIPIRYNLRSIVVRRVGTAMTILGVALTVSVFVSILAMIQGLQNTFVETGDPLNLIMMRKGSTSEVYSFFNRDVKGIVETIEGVGEVVRVENDPPGMGVVFTELSQYSKHLIERLLTVQRPAETSES